jgi:hypothetical protein
MILGYLIRMCLLRGQLHISPSPSPPLPPPSPSLSPPLPHPHQSLCKVNMPCGINKVTESIKMYYIYRNRKILQFPFLLKQLARISFIIIIVFIVANNFVRWIFESFIYVLLI